MGDDNTIELPQDGNSQTEAALSQPYGDVESDVASPVVADLGDVPDSGPHLPFNIVGIGASAGGIEAYIELLQNLPEDTGMAFVIVLHLAADQKSYLREILARHTAMPVHEVINGDPPEPNHVYVVPPGSVASFHNGKFKLESHSERSRRPIDVFFRSLAREQKTRAIGVVLSGMDGDGALGLRAIKGEGGITLVQSPESAQFPDMPNSSILGDQVDMISPPGEIAHQLSQLSGPTRSPNLRLLQEGRQSDDDERLFNRALSLMRGVSGVDFRLYKPGTIRRRLARRMMLQHIDSLTEYVALLQSHPGELRELHEDALISVTHFFRDAEVYEVLKNLVIPRIFEDRKPGDQVRIWVAGCATGEEAYSIAICVLEHLTGQTEEAPIQIFGTDASERSIQRARMGIYQEAIAAEVSPERLRRFFVKTEKGYQVAKRVRDMCIFARQNLCHDPPFSRMDLISCRNVLIYFGSELQRRLITTFHYALCQDAFLLLGTSETIREFTNLFTLADRKAKLYLKVGASDPRMLANALPLTVVPEIVGPRNNEPWSDLELQRAADRIVLGRYGPPGVVVNERMEILQSRGHTSAFMEMQQGAATLQLPRMTRENITAVVTAAVRRAIDQDIPVQVHGLKVQDGDVAHQATLEVLPIHSSSHHSKCYLVLFVPLHSFQLGIFPPSAIEIQRAEESGPSMTQMRTDLSSTKLYLQSLLEERDAANEEIQSSNEELQSTNEELETTKEELQSANEELHTVNEELQNRNTILTQASNDLNNLLNSVNLPVLMLNEQLNIRQFTPPTQRVMNVRSTDVGRPFSEIRMNLQIDDLTPIFHEVLESLAPREFEVQDRDGRWYLMRVRPYRTSENKIDGLVVALVDIDQLRRSQQELRAARDFATSVIEFIPLPLVVVDPEFKIRSTNQAFCSLAGLAPQELDDRELAGILLMLWGQDGVRSLLESLRNASVTRSFEIEQPTFGDNPKVYLVRGSVLPPDGEQFLLVTFEDVTVSKEAERQLTSATTALGRSREDLRALTGSLLTTQEDERRRIARELHDDVSQRLAGLDMDTDEVERTIAANPVQAREKLRKVRGGISAIAEDIRNLSHNLHPSIIEDLGLAPALRALTEDIDRNEEVIVTFSARNVPNSIPVEVSTVLYRIAQEAIRNAVKHAGRTHVKVQLLGVQDGLQLEIADAGHGFDTSEDRAGLGLISMQERARIVGGTLQITSSQGHGTKVLVHVPLPQHTSETE